MGQCHGRLGSQQTRIVGARVGGDHQDGALGQGRGGVNRDVRHIHRPLRHLNVGWTCGHSRRLAHVARYLRTRMHDARENKRNLHGDAQLIGCTQETLDAVKNADYLRKACVQELAWTKANGAVLCPASIVVDIVEDVPLHLHQRGTRADGGILRVECRSYTLKRQA